MLPPLQAATTLENYTRRVEEAAKLAADVVENDYSRDEEQELLRRLTDLIPSTEDVVRDAQGKDLTHIDNAWLQQAIEKLDNEDDDARYSHLSEITDRLSALSRTLRSTLEKQVAPEAIATRERLQQILARNEYQPEEEKDSAIQAWLKKIRQKMNELLAKLFFGNSSKSAPSAGSLQAIRWLIILALVASLVWATILLVRRFQLRQIQLKDDRGDEAVLEILGEQFGADVSADDLLKTAAEMARKGEYRLAIRRAYLALLYELEQRGKLRLHRAKTNQDYLGELKNEPYIYPPVTTLTGHYERVWYGDGTATLEDYSGFIEKYREVAR
ncbi:MAG: DUF4129 domain-containing protein [Blastocatellia bacterium]|nr:DUF4129 domain-containing protein [Blastocatellia bacterium]